MNIKDITRIVDYAIIQIQEKNVQNNVQRYISIKEIEEELNIKINKETILDDLSADDRVCDVEIDGNDLDFNIFSNYTFDEEEIET